MSVASWIRSVFTTQDPTTYKSTIDGNFTVIERLAAMFAPQQVATANMTIQIRAGMVFDNGTLSEVALQTTGTITAPAGNPRIDRVVLDQRTGVLSVVTGTPAVSPAAPAIPAGKMPCAQILLQTSSAVITNAMITDERTLASVSLAMLAALYAPLASPTFTGTVNAAALILSGALTAVGATFTGILATKVITETKTAPTISAGALTLDLSAGSIFDVALNAAITTLTLSNPPATGTPIGFTLIFTADGTARAVTWPASVKWAGGTAPTLTSTITKKDFFSFYTQDGGTTYQAFVAGQNV